MVAEETEGQIQIEIPAGNPKVNLHLKDIKIIAGNLKADLHLKDLKIRIVGRPSANLDDLA